MDSKWKQNSFIGILTCLSIVLMVVSYRQFGLVDGWNLLFWILLAIVSESFQIMTSSGAGTSVGIAIYLYAAVLGNPFEVMVVAFTAFLFRFPDDNGERKHIFNTRWTTLLYNASNTALSMGIASYVFTVFNNQINLLNMSIKVAIALFVAEAVNMLLLGIMFKILRKNFKVKEFVFSIFHTFPSTLAIGMLGIFLVFADQYYGKEIVLLFFIPLLLARYSFKLYFDSQRMALDTIHALNEALHAKDAYTGGHTGRVEMYAVDLAKAYHLSTSDVDLIRTAALLHDIGKIGIPDDILNKPGQLTNEEYDRIKEHSSIGAKILGNVNGLKKVSRIIIQHHERYDGKGYPLGLQKDEITIEASILMIADSFDAMTSDRPYRLALTKEEAISELTKFKGTQFHPELVTCFVEHVLSRQGYIVQGQGIAHEQLKEA